ncbi:MAG TPA: hypothetical protein VH502_00965 [Actinoplanes sp.]|jgi:hypothetical protein
MSRTETITPPTRTAPKPRADVRTFWRVLLAVIAPLPMLAKGIYYLISPVPGDADFATASRAFADDPGLAETLRMLDVVFCVLLIPAVYAVVWAARRGAPRLTTVGGLLSLTGCLAGFGLMGGITTPPYLTGVKGIDANAMRALEVVTENDPVYQVASLLFIAGIVLGLGLLGAALWRSRVAPAWFGIALLLGGATHPFIPGSVGQGIGLLVAAVGFAGAGLALLRTRNDDFDLPPA